MRIKVIIKRPDEPVGHETYIRNELDVFQQAVDGYIETIPCGDALIVCNEEGKLRNLPVNFRYMNVYPDYICGTVIVCGVDGCEFADVPFGIDTWKGYLDKWR